MEKINEIQMEEAFAVDTKQVRYSIVIDVYQNASSISVKWPESTETQLHNTYRPSYQEVIGILETSKWHFVKKMGGIIENTLKQEKSAEVNEVKAKEDA